MKLLETQVISRIESDEVLHPAGGIRSSKNSSLISLIDHILIEKLCSAQLSEYSASIRALAEPRNSKTDSFFLWNQLLQIYWMPGVNVLL